MTKTYGVGSQNRGVQLTEWMPSCPASPYDRSLLLRWAGLYLKRGTENCLCLDQCFLVCRSLIGSKRITREIGGAASFQTLPWICCMRNSGCWAQLSRLDRPLDDSNAQVWKRHTIPFSCDSLSFFSSYLCLLHLFLAH